MFEALLGLVLFLLGMVLLWFFVKFLHGSQPSASAEMESNAGSSVASAGDGMPVAASQDGSDQSELSRAISEYLNQHGGLHTAAQLASALSQPEGQVQQALDQLVSQGQVAIDNGRYGTPAQAQAARERVDAIVARLAETSALDTVSELAEALGQSQDQVQSALDELRAQGEVADFNGRYGTPDEVGALRLLADSIRDRLAETPALDTASELAEALGQPQARVQQALDELKTQGEVAAWNGRYGTSSEVEGLRGIGLEIVAHLQNRDGLQAAAEVASALNQPADQVQQALDQLQAQGQVGEWDGRYGVPEEVEELRQLESDILTQLDVHGLQTVSEVASALRQPVVEVQQALDQLRSQGRVSDADGRYGTPEQVAAMHELADAILAQLAKTPPLDTAVEVASALERSVVEVQQALDQLRAQGRVSDANGRYGTPEQVMGWHQLLGEITDHLQKDGKLQTASEVAKGIGKPLNQVQQALDQLKGEKQVDEENGRYGTPAQVRAAQETQHEFVTGSHITDRRLADTASDLSMVDVAHPLPMNGEITRWEIWAENTNPIQLVMYRKRLNAWSVVGASKLENPQVGQNEFILKTPIEVQEGDFIGWYYPQKGVISMVINGPGTLGNLSGTVLWARGAEGTAFENSSNRIYSIRVFGKSAA